VFFYLFSQSPKPSMLDVMNGAWEPNQADVDGGGTPGFGVTTMIINGGVECGGPEENTQSQNRIDYYREFAGRLNVPIPANEVLGCANMRAFDEASAAVLHTYWDRDWSGPAECQLVPYQTRYLVYFNGAEGDYVQCVQDNFDVVIDPEG
jgi:hypothetical protein